MFRQPRKHDEKHLQFIRGLSCVVCGDNTSTEAAHVRFAERRVAKRDVGKAEKPDDKWTLPLCGRCHREQHDEGERMFWHSRNIDPIYVCLALAFWSGDNEAGEVIVRERR
jgi:hypothetical protein